VWIGKYMLDGPDEAGPGAWRGKAIETAIDYLLFGADGAAACNAAIAMWDQQAQGVIDPDAEKEVNALSEFYAQAAIAFKDQPVPLQRQAKVELQLPGISVPLIGYADWLWPDHGSDLKTTWRIPTSPDPAHVEQVAAYSMFHGVPFELVYVSPKRWTRYGITQDMAAEAWDRVIETAHAIRSLLTHVENGHDALSMFSPDYSSFYFRPPMAAHVKAAKAVRVLPLRQPGAQP
jgi:hypothetical protein